MTEWIDLGALWKIVVIGLACGAGLPALFAVGLKALAAGEDHAGLGTGSGASAGEATAAVTTRSPLYLAAAAVCFAVVLAAVGAGIYLIVAGT